MYKLISNSETNFMCNESSYNYFSEKVRLDFCVKSEIVSYKRQQIWTFLLQNERKVCFMSWVHKLTMLCKTQNQISVMNECLFDFGSCLFDAL